MAYIGNNTDHNAEVFKTTKDRFNGNGSTTAFTLSAVPANAESMQVFVNNVRQDSGRAYTVSGTTLTFTEAPSSATGNIYVVFNSVIAGINQVITANTQLRTGVVTQHAMSNTATYSVGELLVAGQITISGGDTSAGDNAALGYTAAEGLILTGQGSTSDITLKNDADGTVFTVPTGTDDILFPDGAKAMFGASSDLQIYHNGTNSIIEENSGSGSLIIKGTNISFEDGTGAETYATFVKDGAATIRYDNATKLTTTAGGVSITGTYTGTGLMTTGGNIVIPNAGNIGSASDTNAIAISSAGVVTLSGTDSLITSGTTVHNEDVTFTGASYNVLWDKSDNRFEFGDNAKAVFGAGDDLEIYHDGSNSYIKDAGTGLLVLLSNNFRVNNAANSELMINAVEDGAVSLYHNGSVKLDTTAGGVSITGTLTPSGITHIPNGSLAAPSLTFTNDTNTGITNNGALNNFYISIDGSMRVAVGSVIQFGCDGSAGTAALSFNADWDSGIFHPAADAIAITTAGTERLRVVSGGNAGIGVTAPPEKLTVKGNIKVDLDSYIGSTPADSTAIALASSGGSQMQFYRDGGDDGIKFFVHDTGTFHGEAARLDQFGNFRVGCAGVQVVEGGAMSVSLTGMSIASPDGVALQYYMIKSSDVEAHIGFKTGTDTNWYLGTAHGISGIGSAGVYQTNTGAGWTNVSDENYKKALQPITNALDKIKDCRGMTGLYKSDPDDRDRRSFLIAQDWIPVLPEAVDQNTTDDDDVTQKLGLQYDATIPLLVEAIKELRTQNIAYAARIAALEG